MHTNCAKDTINGLQCNSCTSRTLQQEVAYSSFVGEFTGLSATENCVPAPNWMCPNEQDCCRLAGSSGVLCGKEAPNGYLNATEIESVVSGEGIAFPHGLSIGSAIQFTAQVRDGHGFEIRLAGNAVELELAFNFVDKTISANLNGEMHMVGDLPVIYDEVAQLTLQVEFSQLHM